MNKTKSQDYSNQSTEIKNQIESNFPFPSFRTHQKETLSKILSVFNSASNPKKFIVLEAPTGSGKSPIAITLSRIFSSSYILTPQKILQDQYMKDFGSEIIDLKGRSNYTCFMNHRPSTEGLCKMTGMNSNPDCNLRAYNASAINCPYHQRIREAQLPYITLFNFKSFLHQTKLGRFQPRKLLIIDECHNTEQELVSILSIKITETILNQFKIPFPQPTSVSDALNWLDNRDLINKLSVKIGKLKDEKKFSQAEKLEILLTDLKFLRNPANKVTENFVVDNSSYQNPVSNQVIKSVLFRPLYIKSFSNRLFKYADKILLMSATVLNYKLMTENLGIPLVNSTFIKIPSIFPKQNRPIIIKPVGFMTYAHIDDTLPKLVSSVETILTKYSAQKGIIHTHSFKILNYIKNNINSKFKYRLLFQNDFKFRERMIEVHKTSYNTVIVAPAMHEGLDLVNDLSRFQIICKVPYASSKGDVWMTRRTKDSWNYYIWLTVLKLVQSYGRSVRNQEDKAITIILDSQIEKFLVQAKYMLPSWFKEAIIRKKQ